MMSLKSNSKEVALREVVHSYLQDFLFREDEIAWSHQQGLRTKRWTYSHIAQVALQFVQYLAANGIKKGDRVIFWGANSPQWVAGFWGCLAAGVVVVPIDWQSREDFVAKVDAQVDAKLLLIDKERSDKVRELQLEVVFFEDLKEKVGAYDYKQTEMASVEGKDLAEIIFTSGTTAEPKGVCLSHKNILANLAPLEEEIRKYTLLKKLFHPIRFLNLLPFSHVFGQFMGIFIPQLLSGEVFLFNSVHPVEVMELIRREKISVMVAVPRLLETLREKVERDWIDKYGQSIEQELEKAEGKHFIKNWWRFRSIHSQFGWKFWGFVSGGATLASETELFWRRLGFAVIQGYGMTETASLVSVVHPFKMSRGSIGKSLPGREIKIDGNGEILVRGENISVGVWRSGVTKITDEEGWLRTGDIAERDSDGNLFFKGRKKEVIVTSAGMNVYPQDLESALNRQPEVKTSAVVGIEGQRGTEPVAFLILKPGSYDAASIIARANELLSEYQKIRKWYIWPEEDFPRTSTQKVKKTDLIAAMSGDEPVRATSEFLISKIAQLSGSNLEYDPMSKITTDLKLDSLGKVELISALEDYYQVEVEDSLFTESMTLAEIETIIKEKLGKKAVSFRHSGL
ncbi:MAG: AMP-binding protein, partial [Blastocatellia bacterium]|nr:AMP-binding protein [Blastocatellia bacterium]